MPWYLYFQHQIDSVTWRYHTRRGRCLGILQAPGVGEARERARERVAASRLRIWTSLYTVRVVSTPERRGRFLDPAAEAPTQCDRSPAGVGLL